MKISRLYPILRVIPMLSGMLISGILFGQVALADPYLPDWDDGVGGAVSWAGAPTHPLRDDFSDLGVSEDLILRAYKQDQLWEDADSSGAASPGDTILYQVIVENVGSSAANDVLFNDAPSADMTLVVGSVQTAQGTVTGGNMAGDTTVIVDIGAVPSGSQVLIRFRVTIHSPLTEEVTQIANQGAVTSSNGRPIVTDDPDTATVDDPTITPIVLPIPDLRVTKWLVPSMRVGDGIVTIGETISYMIRVDNVGNTTLKTIPLVDNYKNDFLGFINAIPAPTIGSDSGTLIWNDITSATSAGNLASGDSIIVVVSFITKKSTSTEPNQQTVNVATVSGARDQNNMLVADRQDDEPIRITNPSVEIRKTMTSPADGKVAVGGEAIFTLRVINLGDTDLVTIPVQDLFDASALRYVRTSISAPQKLTVGSSGELFWPDITTAVGDLAVGDFAEFTVTFELMADRQTTNLARVGESLDANGDMAQAINNASIAGVSPAAATTYGLWLAVIENAQPQTPIPTPTPTATPTPTPTPVILPEIDRACPSGGCPITELFHPTGIALHKGANALFIASRDTDRLLKFDLASNTMMASAATGDEPWDVLVIEDRNEIYVSNFMGNSVWVYNAETLAIKWKIAVGPNPALMDYLPKIGTVAVVVRGVNGIAMLNANTYTISSFQSSDGKGTYGLAVDPEHNWVLTTNRDTGNARVLYWDSGSWFKGIELKFGERSVPFEAAYNPANQKLYIVYENGNWFMDILQVENPQRMPRIATVGIGNSGNSKYPDVGGTGLAINPTTGDVWNVNTLEDSVTVISGATDQVIHTIPTGNDPYEITIHPQRGIAYVTLRRVNGLDKIAEID